MNPSVITTYRKRIRDGLIEPDPVQAMAVEKLQILANRLIDYEPEKTQTAPRGWFGFGSKAAKQEALLQGLYLAGGVGRGKSMLMDLFFDAVPFEPKRRVHFHAFMQEVHGLIKQARTSGDGDPIPPAAGRIAREAVLLCFDEFQVTNIADASILGRLFTALFEAGVIVVATSNRLPETLYWNGLNRDRFLPFIDLMGQRVDVLSLDGEKDYRLARLLTVDIYHAPLDDGADGAMDAVNIKISKFGGLTRARQARDLCASLGIAMTIEDSWGGDITTAAIAHLAHSTPPELLFTSTDFNSYVTVSTAEGAPQRQNGRLAASTLPGLGITPRMDVLGEAVAEFS